jgi:Clp amino terminal domain, pathogenicity island component
VGETFTLGELCLVDDVSSADWIVAGVRDFEHDVGSLLPVGFDAYARVCHPALRRLDGDAWAEVSWSQVATVNGRVARPRRQPREGSRAAFPDVREWGGRGHQRGSLAGPPCISPRRPGGELEPGDTGATMLGEVISRAFGLAGERHEALGTEHILLALAEQASTKACDILERHGLSRSAIENILDDPPSSAAPTSPP